MIVLNVMTNGLLIRSEHVHKTVVMDTLLTDQLVLACNATKLVHFAMEKTSVSALHAKTDTSQIIQRRPAVNLVMMSAPPASEIPTRSASLVMKASSYNSILIVLTPALRECLIMLRHGHVMTAVLDVMLVKRLTFVMNVLTTISWLEMYVRNAVLNVSTAQETLVLSVMTNGLLTKMVHVSRTVEMETLLMTNLVLVSYVMMLVLFVMEQILVNVLHVPKVMSKQMAKMDVSQTVADGFKSTPLTIQCSTL